MGKYTELRRLYVIKRLTQTEVARRLGVSAGTVYNRLRAAGIPGRSISAAKKGQPLSRATIEARVKSTRKYTIPGRPLVGYILANGGYVYVRRPDHPCANALGYVAEHRLVIEKRIGRYLLPHEHVHHKNEKRTDNRDSNLLLLSRGVHTRVHNLLRSKELSRQAHARARAANGTWI